VATARVEKAVARGSAGGLACALLVALLGSAGCAKERAQSGAPRTLALEARCFDALAKVNSAQTKAVFASRQCQSGGVTWAALLGVLARRHGAVAPLPGPAPGFTGDVRSLNGKARFAIDEEGDGAQFCSDDPELLKQIRNEYERLNGDATLLRGAMAETTALELECLEADGGVPTLPALNAPPERPASLIAAERAEIERLQQLLKRQQTWCFPPDDFEKRKGALRFTANDQVIVLANTGQVVGHGKLNWPGEGSGDTRVELTLEFVPGAPSFGSPLLHLDVGDSGRLGFDYVLAHGTQRIDLIPNDSCLRAR
jgi:hypothetical protein